jgi:hypothetical protein
MMTLELNELAGAYGLSAVGMVGSLLLTRADKRAYWRLPVYSAMCLALGVILWNLLRKHLIPPEWTLTHTDWLYYGALGMYVALGFLLGLFLGRLTRRREHPPGYDSAAKSEEP